MDFSEKWGTDVDEAVRLALLDLKLTKEEVEITVLEEPSKGFFGIGSKLAKVRVEKKKIKAEEPKKPAQTEAPKKPRLDEEPKQPKQAERQTEKKRPEKRKPEKPSAQPVKKERQQVVSVINNEKEDLKPIEQHVAIDFLKETTEKMGLILEITAMEGKEALYLSIQGKDSGTVIGKRGQTLDAMQYLTSLVVNKEQEKYKRVVVDAENYRAKREKTLQQLAGRLAEKVIKTRRSVRLEPMNPYERKVIHATLQSNPKITTKSEGEEPYRRVIIELK